MSQITKGPLPPEDAAVNYANGLYGRLRCERGWRADAFLLLRREYAHFMQMAIADEFGVQAMWEYMQLVEATSEYLRHKKSNNFSAWFYIQVCANLKKINALMDRVPFDEWEDESMYRALDRIVPTIKSWKVP